MLALAFVLELEVVVEPLVAGDLAERLGDAGQDREVVLRVVRAA